MKRKMIAMVALVLMVATGALAQNPSNIGSIKWNSVLGAYEINCTQNLWDLADYVNGTGRWNDDPHTCEGLTFKVTADIDLGATSDWNDADGTENNFTAIGIYGAGFKGTFDGGNHTISGIRIYKDGDGDEDSYQGLFGFIDGGTVSNVVLSNARIRGYVYVGGIAGECYGGRIENCHVTATVAIGAIKDFADNNGGIAGYNNSNGTITGCTSAANIDGKNSSDNYGGIVGYNYKSIMSGNFARGGTIGNSIEAGAVCGYNDEATLSNNYYKDCTVNDKTSNIGVFLDQSTGDGGDIPGAMPGVVISHGAEVEATENAATLTIPAHKDLKEGSTTEYEVVAAQTFSVGQAGTEVTLAYKGTVGGKTVVWSVKNASGEAMPFTVSGKTITFTLPDEDMTVTTAVFYDVTLAEGTEDADSWTAKASDGTPQALPLQGVTKGQTVTLTYGGRLKVKSLKAVKKIVKKDVTITCENENDLEVTRDNPSFAIKASAVDSDGNSVPVKFRNKDKYSTVDANTGQGTLELGLATNSVIEIYTEETDTLNPATYEVTIKTAGFW